ncbi:hypothetical protein [Streptomyces sp. NBC_01197]|uniref:hypothetical protein n=1 Tax=Streptomyces sp. NBC_01197 TaxID=2903768 RepID=UPI002E0D4370|nr:hypothetical protein OG452_15195 [Streptomyces sp. NBC_01197]
MTAHATAITAAARTMKRMPHHGLSVFSFVPPRLPGPGPVTSRSRLARRHYHQAHPGQITKPMQSSTSATTVTDARTARKTIFFLGFRDMKITNSARLGFCGSVNDPLTPLRVLRAAALPHSAPLSLLGDVHVFHVDLSVSRNGSAYHRRINNHSSLPQRSLCKIRNSRTQKHHKRNEENYADNDKH